ncbi:hypothetical protein NE237_021451 [Protea cynaroides]|uniref:Uncharacterized protein n=1 Tax=Protea cynaroides TaxID=273540 RepID=A0A9Q0HAA4_9MAGN|nr:hypothetical protein NE237_021451 [Protea cynaroides]
MVNMEALNKPPILSDAKIHFLGLLEGGTPASGAPLIAGELTPIAILTLATRKEKGKSWKGLEVESSQGSLKMSAEVHDEDHPLAHYMRLLCRSQVGKQRAQKPREKEAQALFVEVDKEAATIEEGVEGQGLSLRVPSTTFFKVVRANTIEKSIPSGNLTTMGLEDIPVEANPMAQDATGSTYLATVDSVAAAMETKSVRARRAAKQPMAKFVPEWRLTVDDSMLADPSLALEFTSRAKEAEKTKHKLQAELLDTRVVSECSTGHMAELEALHNGTDLLWKKVEDKMRVCEDKLKVYQDQLFSTEAALRENKERAKRQRLTGLL